MEEDTLTSDLLHAHTLPTLASLHTQTQAVAGKRGKKEGEKGLLDRCMHMVLTEYPIEIHLRPKKLFRIVS